MKNGYNRKICISENQCYNGQCKEKNSKRQQDKILSIDKGAYRYGKEIRKK